MPLFRRRAVLPDDVRAGLDLATRERVLASAPLTDGWAVATSHGLHLVRADAGPVMRPWVDVSTGRLDADAAILTVSWVDGSESLLQLADNRSMEFPRIFRQCVDTSLVHSEQVALPRGASARVALRRTADGRLVTQVLGTGDVDLGDPAVAAAVDAAEVHVRDAAGLL